ncbi:MAG: c-type cytochrome [Thermoleophilia bacterium]
MNDQPTKAPLVSTRQRRFLMGFLAVVVLAIVVVLVAQLFTGCWVDVGNEMGAQQSVGYVEPPRSSAPEGAVPFGGPDIPVGDAVPANPVTRTAESEERGRGGYILFCAPCHGDAALDAPPGMVGDLIAPPPPNLVAAAGVLGDGDIFLAVSKGFGRMPPLASRMNPEERWHLVNYLRSLVAGPPPTSEVGSGLLRGALVFSVQCASCHGPTGQGALGPALYPSSLLAESTPDEIVGLLRAGRPSRGMPAFGARVAEGELIDLTSLLRALQTRGPSVLTESLARLRTTTTTLPQPTTTTTTAAPGSTTTTTSPSASTTTTAGGGIDPAVKALGQKVYSASCAGCHGVDGSGGIGPALKPNAFIAGNDDAAVLDVVKNGRAGTAMPNWSGRLSPEEIDAVVALLRDWQQPGSAGATEVGGPVETIPFTHRAHLAKGVSCLFCHSSALRGPAADLPPLELCAGCHRWISTQTEQTKTVVAAFDEGKTVSWARAYDLPDFTFFSHQPHVATAKLSCTECHGDVSSMTLITKARRMTMGFCLACHKLQEERDRLIDCQICHK